MLTFSTVHNTTTTVRSRVTLTPTPKKGWKSRINPTHFMSDKVLWFAYAL